MRFDYKFRIIKRVLVGGIEHYVLQRMTIMGRHIPSPGWSDFSIGPLEELQREKKLCEDAQVATEEVVE